MAENRSQYFLRQLATPFHGMFAAHEHFRLNDWNQPGFLTQCGVTSQCVCVGLNATPTGNPITHGNYGTPLGKSGAHLGILRQAVA